MASVVDKIVLRVELDLSKPNAAAAAEYQDDAGLAASLTAACGTDAGRIEFIGYATDIQAEVTRHEIIDGPPATTTVEVR